MEPYASEVRARWGDTEAFSAYQNTDDAQHAAGAAALELLMDRFAAAAASGMSPDSDAVQALVADWQACISAHFYPCSDAILRGLGQMYLADDRFRQNLDAHGAGTASLLAAGIAAKCG